MLTLHTEQLFGYTIKFSLTTGDCYIGGIEQFADWYSCIIFVGSI